MQPAIAVARLVELAQVAGVDLAALAHPLRRRALVGDADLPVGIAQQPPHDGRADRAGASGDEDAVHRRSRLAGSARRPRSRRRTPGRRRTRSRGRRRGSPARAVRAIARERLGRRVRGVVRGDDDDVGAASRPRRSRRVGVATTGSWTATSASSRSSRRISLCESESRSSSVSPLNASPSTATLRSRRSPSRRLIPSTRNSGTLSLTRETASSMPGALRALLAEREVLAQARAGGEARAARSRRAGSRG